MSATQAAVDAAIDSVIQIEKGYWDDPIGGPTNLGVTLPVLSEYLGHQATVEVLKGLDVLTARDLYVKKFVYGPGLIQIDDPTLLLLVVDCGVNHGLLRPIEWLQTAAEVAKDGHFGPVSAAAVNGKDPKKLYRLVLAARTRFYGELLANPSRAGDAAGWLARAAHFIELTP